LRASLIHAHHARHVEDLDFWLSLANQQGDPILELACGTGRLLIPLLRAGCDLTGVDHDAGMLEFLKSSLPTEMTSRASIVQADIASYQFARQFSLIILGCNTFNTLPAVKRAAALSKAREHLLPDGVFAVSMPNPNILADLPAYGEPEVEEVFTHPQSGNPVQVSSEYSKEDDWVRLLWHYDHLLPDGTVERSTIETRHTLTGVEVFLEEAEAARLRAVELYGDYDRSKFAPGSPYLILCLKPVP